MTTSTISLDDATWARYNERYLRAEMEHLRLRLRRRVRWLRHQWARDANATARGFAITDAHADRLLERWERSAETRFTETDGEAGRIMRLLHEGERELSEDLTEFRAAGYTVALETLQHLFGLSLFERNVILLCLAPELDSSFERLYGYVQDDATRIRPTPELALSLFVANERETQRAWHSFQAHAPLRRFRLVVPGEGDHLSTLALRLPERVIGYLQGFNQLDREVGDLLRPAVAVPLAESHESWIERLERWAAPQIAAGAAPRLNIIGPSGAGRQGLAFALCRRIGVALHRLDVGRLVGRGPEAIRSLEREAALLGLAFYVDTADLDESGVRLLEALMGDLRAFLLIASRQPWRTHWSMMRVTLVRPSFEDRQRLWERALAEISGAVTRDTIAALVQQFELGPAAMQRALIHARSLTQLDTADQTAVTDAELWRACRELAALGMDGLAQRLGAGGAWDDIVVPDDVRRQLEEIAGQVASRHHVYATWGFGPMLSRGQGITALFAGPSGTGKTMAAEILARHLRLDLYRVDLSGVVSKYIGDTEKNLARVFDAAERSGAILLFDEADALFGKRSEVRDSHDRYANIEIDYLLQRMEDYRGLAILATNMKAHLDQAFLRRLRFVLEFPFPDSGQRLRIWRRAFPAGVPLDAIDWEALARLELTGGNIKNIVLNAAFLAAHADKPIGMGQLMRAALREYAKEEKLITRNEFGAYAEVGRR